MYLADEKRYEKMEYVRCGKSGVKLPKVSLGIWHNFGYGDRFDNMKQMVTTAFDAGITHIDMANNYGPPPGSAEEHFGKILKQELSSYRDELFLSSKAGYYMWQGPYGEWGSRKYIMASIDQSLKRTGLSYFDLFYSHRPDPNTPIEETMGALADIVKQGKALYVGISNYNPEQTKIAVETLGKMGVKCLIHQHSYSMFNRTSEQGLFDVLKEKEMGSIAFSPLAQGQLTDRYLNGIPSDSRVAKNGFLKRDAITPEKVAKIQKLNDFANELGLKLSQMALLWVLRQEQVTSVLIGASKPEQILENAAIVNKAPLSDEALAKIEALLK